MLFAEEGPPSARCPRDGRSDASVVLEPGVPAGVALCRACSTNCLLSCTSRQGKEMYVCMYVCFARRIGLRSHKFTWSMSKLRRIGLRPHELGPRAYLLGGNTRPLPEANQSGWHAQTPPPSRYEIFPQSCCRPPPSSLVGEELQAPFGQLRASESPRLPETCDLQRLTPPAAPLRTLFPKTQGGIGIGRLPAAGPGLAGLVPPAGGMAREREKR
jgi:hypothetical protein